MLEPTRRIDRRSLLTTGTAALGALGLTRVLGPTSAAAHLSGDEAPRATIQVEGLAALGTYMFSMDIDDLEIETLATTGPTAALREMTTGADWDYRAHGPGDVRINSMTVRVLAGTAGAEEARAWADEARSGACTPRRIVVRYDLPDGTARSFTFHDCVPTSYAAMSFETYWDPGDYSPSSNIACETIVVKMQRVELA